MTGPATPSPLEKPSGPSAEEKELLLRLDVILPIQKAIEAHEERIRTVEADIVRRERRFYRLLIQAFAIFTTLAGTILLVGNAAIQVSKELDPWPTFWKMTSVLVPLLGFCLVLLGLLALLVNWATRNHSAGQQF